MSTWEERLFALGLALPATPVPNGQYCPVVVWNDVAYVAGQVCRTADGVIPGPVDDATDPATIERAGQACVLRALAALDAEVGLDRVARIIFLRGFVFAEAGFRHHPRVLDPASALLAAIFGSLGEHARSAVGVASLPDDGLLEIEMVAALLPRSAKSM
ncbi:RidA family protein [Sphingomonas sp. PvP056]|uniref:RidA family protein n=1 Tax=Sphingomonas sp. PvP056 TaxID=3156392 RepID=UPI00339967F5